MTLLNKLSKVFFISGYPTVLSSAFSQITHYSQSYIVNLIKKKKIPAYKHKHYYYIFIPPTRDQLSNSSSKVSIPLPNGRYLNVNWKEVAEGLPNSIAKVYQFTIDTRYVNGDAYVELPTKNSIPSEASSSTLRSNSTLTVVPLSQIVYPCVKSYKYGEYIIYKEDCMSTFKPGTGGTLKSTMLPSAFFELCRLLDTAELTRNGANPGITPRRNLNTTISFQTGTIAVAATIPFLPTIRTDGTFDIAATDYLGSTYTAFNPGSGDGTLFSTNLVSAFLESAGLLAAAEKAVTPAENQPNNIQIDFNFETGTATISANMPFTTLPAASGDVTVHAIDYL